MNPPKRPRVGAWSPRLIVERPAGCCPGGARLALPGSACSRHGVQRCRLLPSGFGVRPPLRRGRSSASAVGSGRRSPVAALLPPLLTSGCAYCVNQPAINAPRPSLRKGLRHPCPTSARPPGTPSFTSWWARAVLCLSPILAPRKPGGFLSVQRSVRRRCAADVMHTTCMLAALQVLNLIYLRCCTWKTTSV